jgi:iron complex transport system substrate-binding protein
MAPHQTISRRLRPVIATLLVALLAATGCGGASGQSSTQPTAAPVFPATVTHEFGETTVEDAPERVVSLGYTDQDAILALGTVPVAIREFTGNQPSATWPWAADRLQGEQPEVLPATEVTPEAVTALEPDLIVAITANLTREQYDALARIAPTVAAPVGTSGGAVSWADATRLTGAALGLPAEADRLVTEVQEKFVEVEESHPELAGATVVVARQSPTDAGSVMVWSSKDLRGQFLKDIGAQVPADVDRLAGDAAYATLPAEQLVSLDDSDALMVPGTQAEQAAFAALPGYGQLQLVQESKVVTLDDEQSAALAFGSVLSLPAVLDEVAGRLSRAVAR